MGIPAMRQDAYTDLERAERRFLAEELERRIEEFERTDDRECGAFTGLDWFWCTLFFALIPALIILWAA
jgi:hypothetical protein